MGADNLEKKSVDAIKAYFFPTLLSILTMVVYNDLHEVKMDVKVLLAQASEDKIKIEYLQKEIERMKDQSNKNQRPVNDEPVWPKQESIFAILPSNNDSYIRNRKL